MSRVIAEPQAVRLPAAGAGRAWAQAGIAAGTHLALLAALQLENALYHLDGVAPDAVALAFPWRVPFLLLENLLVCALLAALFRALLAVPGGRIAVTGLALLANLHAVLDQVAYKLFFDHLRCSQLEESASAVLWLGDSFAAALDARAAVNLVLAIVATALAGAAVLTDRLGRVESALADASRRLVGSPRALAAIAVYCALAFWVTLAGQSYNIERNPLLVGVVDCARGETVAPAAVAEPVPGYRALRFGEPTPTPVIPTRPGSKPMNVVLVVLESIGAKQLLADGEPDPRIAPFLHRLSQHGAVYDAVYTNYPASIVSNVAITTGGPSLSWGKVREFARPYLAPTIVGEHKRGGFATALFSSADLDFGRLGEFFAPLGFDEILDFGTESAGFRAVGELNSWGADDRAVLRRAMLWLEERASGSQPFYLRVQTNLAHHPYNVPASYGVHVEHPDPEKRKYLNSIHYVDSLLAEFHRELERLGVADDTLLVLTGDHGEAFAEWHATNVLHRSFLYDENVRSFLILANARRFPAPVRSPVPAYQGDIMPTVLAANGLTVPPGLQGQNLLSADYEQRIQYFHKNGHPESYGLRDGRWKFISTFSGDRVELYDLERDPHEQVNVAARHPEMVAEYRQRCATWYVDQNRTFMAALDGWEPIGDRDYAPSDLAEQGPKVLAFGYLAPRKSRDAVRETFTESDRLHPDESVFAWTKWVSFREPVAYEYLWTGPDGTEYRRHQRITPDDIITQIPMRVPRPRAEGAWQLQIRRDGATVLAGGFELSAREPLRNASRVPIPGERIRGVLLDPDSGEQRALDSGEHLPLDAQLAVDVDWPASGVEREIVFRWRSPSGRSLQYPIRVDPGQRSSRVIHNGPYPMEQGMWWLTLREGGRRIGNKLIHVGAKTS